VRKKEKQMTAMKDIEAVIDRAPVCRLAMAADDRPYVVPLCFGYRDGVLYFHTGLKGKKIDILKKNDRVCFEIDVDTAVLPDAQACKWSMRYRSVIGFGRARFIEDEEGKHRALDIIMAHYSGGSYAYPSARLAKTAVIRVVVEKMTGKQS
jgi:nitroimidazol reductase NimA-like FMN-containing flavoprotein (pyridoxamine 5'-phosphate oxidase superfamily)